MSADAEIKPQFLRKSNDPVEDPFASFNLPKANRLEKFACWLYNVSRRRRVKQWQVELEEIRLHVLRMLEAEVLSYLVELRECDECKQQYAALKPVPLLSTLEEVLKNPICSEPMHRKIVTMFAAVHRLQFDKARAISAWICGFEAPKK